MIDTTLYDVLSRWNIRISTIDDVEMMIFQVRLGLFLGDNYSK
jgi:hypothetical protein